MSNNIVRIKISFEKKFKRAISIEEITYIVNINDFLSESPQSPPSPPPPPSPQPLTLLIEEVEEAEDDVEEDVEDEVVDIDITPRFEIDTDQWWAEVVGKPRSKDKTLASHLKQYNKDDGWMQWVQANPSTFESKRVRLQYIIKWADTEKSSELFSEDKRLAETLLTNLKDDYSKGKIENVGVKTSDKKTSESAQITELLSATPPPMIKSVYKLFGEFLPVRRMGDISNFFVFDTMDEYESHVAESSPLNAFIKETGDFKFNDFKNVSVYKPQTFTSDEVRSIALCPVRFEDGISYLRRCTSGKRLINTSNSTAQYSYHNNKLTVNAYRHFSETVLAPKLSKEKQILLRTWLCHSASTASLYYQDS